MSNVLFSCGSGPSKTIFNKSIANATNLFMENTSDPGSIKFKTGSINGDTSVIFKHSSGAIAAAFHSNGQTLFNGPLFSKMEPIEVNGDALPSNTYTAAQILKGIITRVNTGAVIDFSDKMPTAASITSLIENVQVHSAVYCIFRNKLPTNNNITLVDSDDGTFTLVDTNKVIGQNQSQTWLMIVTDIGTPAVSGYLVGSATLV